jgi:hypothetical protein
VSAHSFNEVIAVLDGERDQFRCVLDRAIEIAEVEHARLTLAKTTSAGWPAGCTCVFPIATVPPAASLEEHARDVLAHTAEHIPKSLSLTTVLLGADTYVSLRGLLRRGHYDLLVSGERFLHHHQRLRRALDRMGVSTLAVAAELEVETAQADAPSSQRPAARA